MSFNDSSNLEAQPTTWRRQDDPQYADDPEFQSFSSKLSEDLFTLTRDIGRLEREVATLGTKRETERVRERVADLLQKTGDAFKDIGDGVKKVQSWHDMGPSQKYTANKLAKEFRESLTTFQGLQRLALDKQRASASAAKTALESEGVSGYSDDSGRPQQQQQLQQEARLANQSEVDFQEQLIVEREREIQTIESSVSELNELFRDVATMVHDQGANLDIITANVEQTRDDTRNADQQLRTAARHQKSARGKACCLLIILAIVLTVVVLAVVLS